MKTFVAFDSEDLEQILKDYLIVRYPHITIDEFTYVITQRYDETGEAEDPQFNCVKVEVVF
jgi:hypothetical protein